MSKFTLRLLILLLFSFVSMTKGQNMDALQADDLYQSLRDTKADSTRAVTYSRLAEFYRNWKPDSTLYYGEKGLNLSRAINHPSGEAKALSILSHYYFAKGELPKGLELGLEGLRVARRNHLIYDEASLLIRIANVYANLRDFQKSLAYYHQAISVTEGASDLFFYGAAHWRMGDAFAQLNEIDSAIYYAEKAVKIAQKMGNKFIQQGVVQTLGFAYGKKGRDSLALRYLRSSNSSGNLIMRAIFFKDRRQYDSALSCALRAYERSSRSLAKETQLSSATILAELYEPIDATKALKFLRIAQAAQESISGSANVLSAKAIELDQQQRDSETRLAEINLRNRFRLIVSIAGFVLALAIALLVYRNYRKSQTANALLEQQKKEINQALSDLRKTQSQLIQSEKMASLGELTAGIAHEIQNPLNFVNNFSEVNAELIEELKAESSKPKAERDDQVLREILETLKENELKVVQHGKRADAIVKGMLQHSRKSSGQKEFTDINALCDEYLHLAYHGLRAKDKSFNAKFETHLDPTVPMIHVVPQDIGRVVLNLINNAFYAVSEKAKQGTAGYEPTVSVRTSLSPGEGRGEARIQITVSDNGPGIPNSIKDKIFQPFFTTKPTGQGTGLGLSLSYDIVTKGHGGELKVDTKEGEGSVLTIILPS